MRRPFLAPAGTHVASRDSKGKLRIWAYDHEEHLAKLEVQVLAGRVRDVGWDFEGRRIVVVGEGGQSPESGKVIQWDTGVKCRDLGQHQRKKGASCAFRPCRPMRIATGGGEDGRVFFHKGPPFVRVIGSVGGTTTIGSGGGEAGEVSEKCHERGSVHGLRYNKDGSLLASVGTDGSVCFYDGKTMTLIQRIEKVHSSSIFSCAWNREGTHLLTCGADGYARLLDGKECRVVYEWDVAGAQLEQAGKIASKKVPVGGMQLGCSFIKGNVPISVGYNGQICVLPMPTSLNLPFSTSFASTLTQPYIITGHQAPISAMTFGPTNHTTTTPYTIYTADTDGVIVYWDGATGQPIGRVHPTHPVEEDGGEEDLLGKVHGGATISSLAFCANNGNNMLYSAGWDDCIRITKGTSCVKKLSLEAQPNAMAVGSSSSSSSSLVVVLTVEGLVFLRNEELASEMIRLEYGATAVCLSHDDSTLYVGGNDCNIYVYSIDDSCHLTEIHVIRNAHLKPVQSLSLSHDGTKLAAADVRDVCIYSLPEYTPLVSKGRWCFHTQAIKCLTWSPDDTVLASGGNDDDVYLWCVGKKTKRVHYRFVHRGGVTGLRFVGRDGTGGNGGNVGSDEGSIEGGDWMLVSTGSDGCINWWDVKGDVESKFK